MNLNISSEKYNPFMKRKELVVGVEHSEEPTPSVAQLTELLTRHVNKESGYIEITRLLSDKGMASSKAWVFVWDEKRIVKAEQKEENKAEQPSENIPTAQTT